MSTTPYIWLLVPLAALVAIVLGGILVTRLQKATSTASAAALASLDRPARSAGGAETREEFVRRHRHQPGVIADGTTLIDLYDRIRELEERLAAIEAAPRP